MSDNLLSDLVKAIHFATPLLRKLVDGGTLGLSTHSSDEVKKLVTLLSELGYLEPAGFMFTDGSGYQDYTQFYKATHEGRDFLRPYMFPSTPAPLKDDVWVGVHRVEIETDDEVDDGSE